ncbi:MAG: HAMP domain-containing histidine kinase [Pelagimonas sp.]|jgi:signal transduction histidine kinase|nr:HAMP domain-containing histidine kinase [Pelagimonas sp.]
MKLGLRLHTLGLIVMGLAFALGVGATALWMQSVHQWRDFQAQAFMTGVALDGTLRRGAPVPIGITLTALPGTEADKITSTEILRLPDLPKPAFVTTMTLHEPGQSPLGEVALSLVIVSGKLRYSIGDITSEEGQSAAQKLGAVTRLLATYCSEPVVFAQAAGRPWMRIDGAARWGCSAAPPDHRLLAVLLSVGALMVLAALMAESLGHFDRFAHALRDRTRLGGPESYPTEGPHDLREIVSAVNSHLKDERARLHKRAVVLSGVSHDLGTPATRLRLRTALIPDPDLRGQFQADIDSMTGMIESVLTYTRAEMNTEAPRKLALMPFVQAIVDDYHDLGRPVEFQPPDPDTIKGGVSVFSGHPGHGALPQEPRILVIARPIALQRALSNLIDNALKYGRRAHVGIEANASHVVITVEDEGSDMSVADIEKVFAPFKRGDNTGAISGFGLGLTIVATVAEQHGGQLRFEQNGRGLRACLEICRN